jgi:hypothetical protein
MGMGGNLYVPAALPLGVPLVYKAVWASGSVRTGAENLAPTGVRSPDCPARSESLYKLSYLGPLALKYRAE